MDDKKRIRPARRRGADESGESLDGAEELWGAKENPDAQKGPAIGGEGDAPVSEPDADTGDLYRIYMEEVAAIKACDARENERLLGEIAAGNGEARKRLIEGNLRRALLLAQDFLNRGVSMADLIQEASVELMLLADELAGGSLPEGPDAERDFAALMDGRIRDRLRMVLEEQKREEETAEETLARVNVLQEVSRRMAEELGREATLLELAGRMQMTEDEVERIMRITMDALSLSETSRNP